MSSPPPLTSDASVVVVHPPTTPFARFADRLLAVELPDLPADRRNATVSFIGRRVRQIPTPLRIGVELLAVGVGVLQRLVGVERSTDLIRRTPLPFVGELARLVRSLGFAYIWETWPSTSPTGGPE